MTEILVSLAILATVFAISLPVFAAAKMASKRSDTVQSFEAMGRALLIYRADWEASPTSSDGETMGFPPNDSEELLRVMEPYDSHYKNALGKVERVWYVKSARTSSNATYGTWSRYVNACGQSSVLLGDFTHNDFNPLREPGRTTYGIGLRLDGGVTTANRTGSIVDPYWWDCKK